MEVRVRAAEHRQRLQSRSGKAEKKAADVVNDLKAVIMNLASLITPSYFPSTYGSRSVVTSPIRILLDCDNNFLC